MNLLTRGIGCLRLNQSIRYYVNSTRGGIAPLDAKKVFGYCNEIEEILQKKGYVRPTPIQSKALPVIQNGRDILLQDETGSGKSFSIIYEIINRYYTSLEKGRVLTEDQPKEDVDPVQVKYLILTPSRELAWQLGNWSRDLMKELGLDEAHMSKIQLAVPGKSMKLLNKELQYAKPEILIGIPRVVHQLLTEENTVDIKELKCLYIDEADQIFQALSHNVDKKQRKIRKQHPLPGHLLLNELKRRTRLAGHLKSAGEDGERVSGEDQIIKLIKKDLNKHQAEKAEDERQGYVKTKRPYQTIISSATLSSTTKQLIEDKDWINSSHVKINTYLEKMNAASDMTPQLSVPQRMNYYFVPVDSEVEILDAISDALDTIKPSISVAVLSSDANITNVIETLRARGINAEAVHTMMNYNQFNSAFYKDQKFKEYLEHEFQAESTSKHKSLQKELAERGEKRKLLMEESGVTGEELQDALDQQRSAESKLELPEGHKLYVGKLDSIRGIDISSVSHVFIVNVNITSESFIHMVGRTGRMGRDGNVICIYESSLSGKYKSTVKQLGIEFIERK